MKIGLSLTYLGLIIILENTKLKDNFKCGHAEKIWKVGIWFF